MDPVTTGGVIAAAAVAVVAAGRALWALYRHFFPRKV